MALITKLPLDSPDRRRISLNAMITCARVQFFIGVLIIVFQIPVSGFTLYRSLEKNATTGVLMFRPISLFLVDCWFPGLLFGVFAIFCARYQFRKFAKARIQVRNLHEVDSLSSRDHPKWTGLVLSRPKSFFFLAGTALPAYGFLMANGLAFLWITRLTAEHPEIPYETRLYIIFFHTGIFLLSIPLFCLIVVGVSSLTIVTGHCCSWVYPFPIYMDFSDGSKLTGLYGHAYMYSEIETASESASDGP